MFAFCNGVLPEAKSSLQGESMTQSRALFDGLENRRLFTTGVMVGNTFTISTADSMVPDQLLSVTLNQGALSMSGNPTTDIIARHNGTTFAYNVEYSASNVPSVAIVAGNGNDTVLINNNLPYNGSTPLPYVSVETGNGNDFGYLTGEYTTFYLGAGNDRAGVASPTGVGSGFPGSYIDGGSGNDTVTGSHRSDIIIGSTGDDQLIGNDGNDVITMGQGADWVHGGDGDDTFKINFFDTGRVSVWGHNGNDSIVATGAPFAGIFNTSNMLIYTVESINTSAFNRRANLSTRDAVVSDVIN